MPRVNKQYFFCTLLKLLLELNCGTKTVFCRLKLKEADLDSTNHKLLSADAQISQQQARINEAVSQRRYWEDEFNVIITSKVNSKVKFISSTYKFLHRNSRRSWMGWLRHWPPQRRTWMRKLWLVSIWRTDCRA